MSLSHIKKKKLVTDLYTLTSEMKFDNIKQIHSSVTGHFGKKHNSEVEFISRTVVHQMLPAPPPPKKSSPMPFFVLKFMSF